MAKKTEPDYKGKLLRLFREVMLLSRTPMGLSIAELEEKLGVSYRTVYRDMELLRNCGFIPERIGNSKYAIRGLDSETRKFEKNLQFTAEEAGVLANAVSSIGESHPLRKAIMEKLVTFSGMEDVMKVVVKAEISRNTEHLVKAIRDKKQVMLHNYRSASSQSVRSRRVEPYLFSSDGTFLKGFEVDTLQNKTYKIERIEEVVIQTERWKHEKQHEKQKEEDIFGINNGEVYRIKLRMNMRAAQLLQEEFPLSRPYIEKEDYQHYIFEADVHSFISVGRFILGLLDEIEVLESKDLKTYLNDKLTRKRI